MFNVYKIVCRKHDGRLVSYNTATNGCYLDLEYAIGKTTYPRIPNSLLFAFLDLNEATKFCQYEETSEIYLEETSEIYLAETNWYATGILPQRSCYSQHSMYKVESFWKTYKRPEDSYKDGIEEFITDYKSSVCCPNIKLISRIQ